MTRKLDDEGAGRVRDREGKKVGSKSALCAARKLKWVVLARMCVQHIYTCTYM